VAIAQVSSTSYTDNSVVAATSYSYQVEAYDAANNVSPVSNTSTVTTPSPAPDKTVPTAPTKLAAAVVSTNQVNLSWVASTDNVGVTNYDIYRSNTKIATIDAASSTDSNGLVSYGDTSTLPRTSYSYVVYARDAAGNKSAVSNKVSITTPTMVAGLSSVTGTVTGSGGVALSSAKVSYTLNGSTHTVSTNSSGYYVISSLPAGSLNLSYTYSGYVPSTVTVSLLADQNTVQSLNLAKYGAISGTVSSAATSKPLANVVISYQLNGVTKTVKTGNTGVYNLTSLPAGSYTLTYSLTGYTAQTISVTVNNNQVTTQNVRL